MWMSEISWIEWTDAIWNPVRGCTKVSAGCKNCYAETFAERWRGVKNHPFEHGFDLQLVPDALGLPLKWKAPKKIFVNSMSGLFHDGIEEDLIGMVCEVMLEADWHTYQVLTKRSERMRDLLSKPYARAAAKAEHIWWGVRCENVQHGVPRIDHLRHTPVANRFLSVEPLLEDYGEINIHGIHWQPLGGESGSGALPCDTEWLDSVRGQAHQAGVIIFVKQLGTKPRSAGTAFKIIGQDGKRDFKGKLMELWPTHLQVRRMPDSFVTA
jgi:protein gp37